MWWILHHRGILPISSKSSFVASGLLSNAPTFLAVEREIVPPVDEPLLLLSRDYKGAETITTFSETSQFVNESVMEYTSSEIYSRVRGRELKKNR